jgi:hypothetical protein
MVVHDPLRTAIDTAWTAYQATHEGIDAADSRRCLLERHLNQKPMESDDAVEELASCGLAYLARFREDEW